MRTKFLFIFLLFVQVVTAQQVIRSNTGGLFDSTHVWTNLYINSISPTSTYLKINKTIEVSNPGHTALYIHPSDTSSNLTSTITILGYGASGRGTLRLGIATGSDVSKLPTIISNVLGEIQFGGYSTAMVYNDGIRAVAAENYASGKIGFDLYFSVVKKGTSTSIDVVKLNNDGFFETYYGYKNSYATITSATATLDNTNYVVLVDATSNSVTVNLPAIATSDKVTYIIKRIDGSGNTVTIDANSTETIDGSQTVTLSSNEVCRIICKASTGWYKL